VLLTIDFATITLENHLTKIGGFWQYLSSLWQVNRNTVRAEEVPHKANANDPLLNACP